METYNQETVTTGILNELKALNLPNSVQIFVARDFTSLSIHLHNEGGLRPTVYSIQIPVNPVTLVLDTIVCEKKGEHQCLKKREHRDYIKNLILELAQQECLGSVEETESNYIQLGLLYQKRK